MARSFCPAMYNFVFTLLTEDRPLSRFVRGRDVAGHLASAVMK